jgi:hypothetical protein
MTKPRGEAWLAPDFLLELFRDPLDPGYADAAAARRRARAQAPVAAAHRLP